MTDRANNDLAALLTPAPSKGVQFSQGKILTWDRTELRNTIEWRGITLTDVPLIEGLNNLVLKEGDVVGLMGWAPENAKGVGTWWIVGKLSNPGEFISDLTFFLGQVRFMTPDDGYDQMYLGSDTDGEPMTVLYYGDASSSRALQIVNRNWINIRDPEGHEIISNDAASRVGIGRPYLNYHLVPSFSAQSFGEGVGSMWPSTTSTSYLGMLEGVNSMWHPKFYYSLSTSTTGGGSVEWRILFDGTVAVSGTDASAAVVDVPGWGSSTLPGHTRNVVVEARTAGGATRGWIQVTRMYGRQS